LKIIYSAGKRVGADLLLKQFLSNCGDDHEIKVAAYDISSRSVDKVDWMLDSVYNCYTGAARVRLNQLFNHPHLPLMGYDQALLLMKEMDAFNADLVICDYDPIVSNFASILGLRLWHCSPVHLLDGVFWQNGDMRYTGLLEVDRKNTKKLPPAEKTFVCSPFAMVEGVELKTGYEWLIPFSDVDGEKFDGIGISNDDNRRDELGKILRCIPPFKLKVLREAKIGSANWLFCGGESQLIMNGLVAGVNRFCVSPDLNDSEALLNGILVGNLGLGDDLGQIEYLEHYSVEEVERSYEKRFECGYKLRDALFFNLKDKIDEINM